jgi:hypothetical protein
MAGEAHIESIESLKQFSVNLAKLRELTAREVEAIQIELRRLEFWLEEALPNYWEEQRRLANRRWAEARQVLSDCESKVRDDEQRSCSEHRKRLERATERLSFCETKLRLLKQCRDDWKQELDRVRPRIAALNELAETGLPLCQTRLQNHLEIMQKYTEVL